MLRLLSLPLALFLLAQLLLGALVAQDAAEREKGEEKDWLEFYYENPTPDRLVPQMKEWAADGTLENDNAKPALIAFLSQVIRLNRDRIEGWYRDLSGLDSEQIQVFLTAMLFSRTSEADALMRESFGQIYDEQKRETKKILEMPLDKLGTMDMLWGFFYATGSESAIRRIVVAFRFRDAPDRPPGVTVPDGYVPLYKQLPDFALASLVANGERHPRVVEILKELLRADESLLEVERQGILEVLKEIDPNEGANEA